MRVFEVVEEARERGSLALTCWSARYCAPAVNLQFVVLRHLLIVGGCLWLSGQGALAAPATAALLPASPPAVSYSAVHVNGPFIAMTFDDGPNEKLTPQLLDILKERHIHATFFVVGQNAEAHPEILRRAFREGNEIGNHSWSHPAFAKMRDENVRRELQKTDDAIRSAIGVRPVLMRPPYGSITARQKRWISSEFGYRIVLWDVDPLDWKRPGPAVVTSRIVRAARPGSIILSHDIHPGTIKAMPETFDQLLAKGFKFVTVSELIAMGKPMAAQDTEAPSATPSPMPAVSPTAGLTTP
jgi:peptidoglycan/xylan/chitin deacetylase (PgdA/CDA1 family)